MSVPEWGHRWIVCHKTALGLAERCTSMTKPQIEDADYEPGDDATRPQRGYCQHCGKQLSPADSRKRFCSTECREDAGGPDLELTEQICVSCGKPYTPRVWNQQYCTLKCSAAYQKTHVVKRFPVAMKCETCGRNFMQKTAKNRFCSVDCRIHHHPHLCQVCRCELPSTLPANATFCVQCNTKVSGPIDVSPSAGQLSAFNFRNKDEFHEWFNVSFPLFGIKELLRSDGRFPNVTCRTFSGDTIRVHLEFLSPKFRLHQDRVSEVDLIISAVRRPQDRLIYGIPVFALLISGISGDSVDHASLRLSPEAEQMFRSNFRFMIDDCAD